MKKRYQIDKQRAAQQFRKLAAQDDQNVQLVIPLKEVVDLVQRGLMNLALNAFTQVAEGVMDCEVTALVGPKNQANPERADYWVLISNTPFLATDTPATLQNRAGTFASHQTSAPNPSTTIAANGAQGRYVRVQLTSPNYLSLAEVQVFGQ